MSQRVPATKKIKESSLKGPYLLFPASHCYSGLNKRRFLNRMGFMKKIVKIVLISVCLLIFAGILAFLIVNTVRSYSRKVEYVVQVDDSLFFSEYQSLFEHDAEGLPFKFVSNNLGSDFKDEFFGPVTVTAGYLYTQDGIDLVPREETSHTKVFLLNTKTLLPTVPADFKNEKSAENNLLSPTLSLSFSTAAGIEEGKRALPVDGIYAGEEEYPLDVTKVLVCTCLVSEIEESLNAWCENHFGKNQISENTEHDEPVFIASVGDIMVARGAQEVMMQEGGLEKTFGTTLPVLQGADYTIGNLEGVVTESWKNATKTYTFKFKKEVLPYLMEAGFDYLMQTNNHCYDYGEAGFKDTLAAFKEYNVPSSGIGYNKEEARKFYHTEIKGLPLSIISCGAYPVERSGFNGQTTATANENRAGILWKSDELLEDVKKEKEAGYFVIVNVHAGQEYVFKPSASQREFYEALCENGADVVFGSHPHVLQPTEWYGKSLIVYSQGNFLFNGMDEMPGATDSEIVKIGVLDGRIAYVEQYPAVLKEATVRLKSPTLDAER